MLTPVLRCCACQAEVPTENGMRHVCPNCSTAICVSCSNALGQKALAEGRHPRCPTCWCDLVPPPEGHHLPALKAQAERGSPDASYACAMMLFRDGEPKEGLGHLRRAAKAGLPSAVYHLAKCYDDGWGPAGCPVVALGLTPDKRKAARLYEKAAKLGHRQAMNDLGVMHHAGDGLPRNLEEAVHWYEASGTPQSLNALGCVYVQGGPTVPRDDGRAGDLFRRAAEMGSLVARSNLATPRWLLRALLVVGPFAWYVLAPAAAAVAWRGGAAGLAKAAAALVGCRYAAGFALTLAVKRAA